MHSPYIKNSDNRQAPAALPEALRLQIRQFEKHLCRTESIVAVCGGICGLLATFALVFLMDRLWDTSRWMRLLCAGGGAVILFVFLWSWFRSWVLKRRDIRQLARLIQKKYQRLGDRLLGAVELAQDPGTDSNRMSPALRRAAIEQVAGEAVSYSFRDAVDLRNSRKFGWLLAGLSVLTVLALTVFPEAAVSAMKRWAVPLSSTPRYTFVKVSGFPASLVVPHGEDFTVSGTLERARWGAPQATGAFRRQPPVLAEISGGDIVFRIPGQTDPGELTIRVGDFKDSISVKPVLRPELTKLTAHVRFPDYLEMEPEARILKTPHISVIAGSTVGFEADISRQLTHAAVEPGNAGNFSIDGNVIRSAPRMLQEPESFTLTWQDVYGLENLHPNRIDIAIREDEPPVVDCRGVSRAVAILEDETVDLILTARDDFGVKRLWLEWQTVDSGQRPLPDASGTADILEGKAGHTEAEGSHAFSPLAKHVPEGSVVTLRARAEDFHPDREPSLSPPTRIFVVSRARHADIVLSQMEHVYSQLEDVTRLEEELLEDNRALEALSPEKRNTPEVGEKLRENEATESRQADRLDALASTVQSLIQEAMKNSEISESTIRHWTDQMAAMRSISQEEMARAAQSLQQAAQNPGQRDESLAAAVQAEDEAVKKLQQTRDDMDTTLEAMMAESFVNRLRAAASREQSIGDDIEALMPRTIGLEVRTLEPELADELAGITAEQAETRQEVGYIQDDLAGFYSRTRREAFNAVYLDMREKKVLHELDALQKLIADNVSIQAISEVRIWQAQLRAWADTLEPACSANLQCGGGPATELSAEDMETLISLMRTRKQEEMLRKATRLLEEERDTNRRYKSDARKLARKQDELAANTRPLERRVKNEDLRQMIEKIGGEMMNASMFLRRPQTDSATIAIETEIIELLSNSIDEAGGSANSQAEQLLSQAPEASQSGAKGDGEAGSSGGGQASGPAAAYGGEGQRQVDRASGLMHEPPPEFKQMLEAYFRTLETSP